MGFMPFFDFVGICMKLFSLLPITDEALSTKDFKLEIQNFMPKTAAAYIKTQARGKGRLGIL